MIINNYIYTLIATSKQKNKKKKTMVSEQRQERNKTKFWCTFFDLCANKKTIEEKDKLTAQ